MMSGFSKVPALYRPLVKLLHWAAFALIALALLNGLSPVIRWTFIAVVVLWCVGYAAFGHLARPGPALTGIVRSGFAAMHTALMLLLALTAYVALRAGDGPLDGTARTLFLVALGAGLLHGIFHLWRHTALGDGALRNMTPRLLHGLL